MYVNYEQNSENKKMNKTKQTIKQNIKKDYDQTRIKFAMIAGQ